MTPMRAGRLIRLAHTAVLAAVCVVVSGLGHDLSSGVPPSLTGYALALPLVGAVAWWLTGEERSARFIIGVSAAGQVALHSLFGLVSHGGDQGSAHSSGEWGSLRGDGGQHGPAPGESGPGVTAGVGYGGHPPEHTEHSGPGGWAEALGQPEPPALPPLPSSPPPSDELLAPFPLLEAFPPLGLLSESLSTAHSTTAHWAGAPWAWHSSLLTTGMVLAHVVAGAVCGWWLWRGERALVQLALALSLFTTRGLRLLGIALLGVPPEAPLWAAPRTAQRPIRRPVSIEFLRTLPRRGPPLLPS